MFESAFSHAPSTLPSHASIFTSLLPYHHRASFSLRTPLPPNAQTLAETLQAAGYATAAFTGGGQLDSVWGLDQGFETYRVLSDAPFSEVTGQALEWLGSRNKSKQGFFLFLHTYETHHPYTPDPTHLRLFDQGYEGPLPSAIRIQEHLVRINTGQLKIDDADLHHIVATYDAEIRSMDDAFGILVEGLRDLDLYDDTILVFTSDHGEEFGEHGAVGWHSHTLYDELLHVPLIIKLIDSAQSGTTVSPVVRSIDIAPTILSAVGVGIPPEFDGTSLESLVSSSVDPPVLPVASMIEPKTEIALEERLFESSLRWRRWKLYDRRLFDLEEDPNETVDVAAEHPRILEELEKRRTQLLTGSDHLEDGMRTSIPTETREQLRALGYVP